METMHTQGETRIKFVSGLNTIGGNIICFENGDYRVLMDFGGQSGVDISAQVDTSLTSYLLKNNGLPLVDGVYPQASIADIEMLESFEDSDKETIICLSHLHIDHVGSLKHISQQVPVFALADAAPFSQLLEETGLLPDYQLNIQGIEPEEVLEFGPFNITFHESDHDTIGAASIFVETPDLKVVYSGDLRISGYHPDRVMRWAMAARDWQPDLLLIEGTSFSFDTTEEEANRSAIEAMTQSLGARTELALLNSITNLMTQHFEACFAYNGYPQNVERFVRLIQKANKLGRTCVLQENMFRLVDPFLNDTMNVKAFNEINPEDIRVNPGQYFLQVDEFTLDCLDYVSDGIFLHSNGTPLGPYMAGYEAFVQTVIDKGWAFYHASVSGHAHQEDLLALAYLIGAGITVPWHTLNPETYGETLQSIGVPTWLPQAHVWSTAAEIKAMAADSLAE